MTAVGMGRGVSVFEMFMVIGRAGIAERRGTAEEISAYLRSLHPEQLIDEYHRAIAVLASKNLLSPKERAEIAEYAREWVHSQPMSV